MDAFVVKGMKLYCFRVFFVNCDRYNQIVFDQSYRKYYRKLIGDEEKNLRLSILY